MIHEDPAELFWGGPTQKEEAIVQDAIREGISVHVDPEDTLCGQSTEADLIGDISEEEAGRPNIDPTSSGQSTAASGDEEHAERGDANEPRDRPGLAFRGLAGWVAVVCHTYELCPKCPPKSRGNGVPEATGFSVQGHGTY
jgi:hypothetical protein